MFKRKQSKDKDLGEKEKDKDRHQSIAASPPISWVLSVLRLESQSAWKVIDEDEETDSQKKEEEFDVVDGWMGWIYKIDPNVFTHPPCTFPRLRSRPNLPSSSHSIK
jgi:hypothetical protein